MATISQNRASYQHTNNIGFKPVLSPTYRKVLTDIATQSALVDQSRTAAQYNLRITRLKALISQLPRSL